MISGGKRGSWFWLVAASSVAFVASVALAFRLARGPLPFVFWTYSAESQPFELLGLFGGLAIVALAAARARGRSLDDALPSLVAAGVGLAWLGYVAETWERSYDWGCYQYAAQQFLDGGDVYGGCYLYPPPLAEALAAAFKLAARFTSPERAWLAVFLAYQAAQVALVIACARLSVALVERLGVERRRACVFVAIAFLVDAPLLRTLRHNQINLWLLALVLVALTADEAWPLACGAALAFAGQLKLYPLALVLPFLLARRWRVAAGAALGTVALTGASIALGGVGPWRAWCGMLPQFPSGTLMRDNGLHSFVFNTCRLLGWPRAVPWLFSASLFAATALVAYKLWRRRALSPPAGAGRADPARLAGDAALVLVWMLLASPVVWEHHFVLAIPAFLVAAARASSAPSPPSPTSPSWPRLGVAFALALALPTSDVYLLGYHRLAGLLLLLTLL
jgi:hypothetical protein